MANNVKTELELRDVVRVGLPCGNDTFITIVPLGCGLGFTSLVADETDEILPVYLLPFKNESIYYFENGEFSRIVLYEILRSEGIGEHRIRWRRIVKLFRGNDTYHN